MRVVRQGPRVDIPTSTHENIHQTNRIFMMIVSVQWRWAGVFGPLILLACAHQRPIDATASIGKAQSSCERLASTKAAINAPLQTKVAPRVARIEAAVSAGKQQRARAMARRLEHDCSTEAKARSEIASLTKLLQQDRARVRPEDYTAFTELVASGAYSATIICGESLLQRLSARCERPPARQVEAPAAEAPVAETDADDLDLDVQPAAAGDEHEGGSRHLWSWILLGGGAALLATGAVLAGLAQARHDELAEACPYDCTQEQIDGGQRMAVSADVLFAVGGTAVAASVILYFFNRRAPDQGSARDLSLLAGPTGLSLSGRF